MSTISKPNTFSPSTTISSSQMNANFDTLYNDYNGNISANNLATGSITTTKIADANVTTAKLADGAVTTAKIDTTLASGWSASTSTISSVTCNGNRSFTMVTLSDISTLVSPGMRIRTTRTVAAPTQCTSLNGTTQYWVKTSPNKMTFTDDFVVSAWIKVSAYPSSNDAAIITRYNGTSGWLFGISTAGQIELFGFNAGAANQSKVISYQSVPLNKWVHVAAQLDMSTFTATTTTSYIMLDGVDVPASVSRGGTNPTALVQAGNLEIGSLNGGSQSFNGKIAQVAVFNAKVAQATLRGYISQGLIGTETSLASAYSFNGVVTDLNTTTPNDLSVGAGSAVATNADSPFGGQANGTISSTLDYGIVQSISGNTIVIQVPEGCTIPSSGGVSVVAYSNVKAPFGFPSQQGKWRLASIWSNTIATTSNATYGSYASGGWALTVPSGGWDVGWSGNSYITTTTAVYWNISLTALTGLSAAAGVALSRFATATVSPSAATVENYIYIRQPQDLTVASTYVMYTFGATTAAGMSATDSVCEIFAENAYL